MASRYPDEIKHAAKILYLAKHKPKEIADQLKINSARVVYQWAEKYNWDAMVKHESVEEAISRRIVLLTEKERKTDQDLKELTTLINQLDTVSKIKRRDAETKMKLSAANDDGSEGGDQEREPRSNRRRKKKKKEKNDLSHVTPEQLEKIRKELFYEYQHRWHDNKHQRTRFILKSRQIGATFYFAWEALEDAINTGDNQVFLSASRAQADIFKAYMIMFAKNYFDTELSGSPIVLHNGAELRFISTNSRTAQGFHGHLYVDEVFWIPDFEKLNKVASGIAMHKKWRKTYFSTPSVKSHQAYPMWSGDKFNEKRKRNKAEFDLTHATLKYGAVGPDKIWRNIVTVVDAEEQGCDLFDINELRDEYSKPEFDNLLMCRFAEAGVSLFALNDLLACGIDTLDKWTDFNPKAKRPLGNLPVWLGYDPARRGDKSVVVVVAPPLEDGGNFRVLEKVNLKGSYSFQAKRIKDITERYNVQFIGIDITGPGLGVIDEVKAFFPRATPIHYSLETKTSLVIKGQDVVENRRIEWAAEDTDIPQSFTQITQTTTGSGQITYAANRSAETGHADVAFAVLHALHNEPLNRKRRKASVGMAA